MADKAYGKKAVGRSVCEDAMFRGVSPLKPPNWNKEGEVNRHYAKEENANWKIKCSCGAIRYLNTMDISEVDAVVAWWHPGHKKYIFNKVTMGEQTYRGAIPAVQPNE
jgi:hypothetical protein